MEKHVSRRLRVMSALCGIASLCAASAALADGGAPPDGRIGYAMISLVWAVHQTPDGKQECPRGFNDYGPREQFKVLFPEGGTHKLVDSHLAREIAYWHPTLEPEQFEFLEAGGPVGIGLNLDGEVDENDFTSPDGEKGIDNELYRVLGCTRHYRGPDGQTRFFDSKAIVDDRYNRTLIELTNVDSMVDDPDVDVTFYRGLDRLLTNATGNILPGGSQRLDTRRGAKFVHRLKGRIENGVLTTVPADITFPWSTFGVATVQHMHAMRLRLALRPDEAEGLMAGYTDLENWYSQMMKSESTHHQSYGQLTPSSMYRSLRRHVDGYPDPKTGVNTAISSALEVKFAQVFIIHPEGPVAAAPRVRPVQEAALPYVPPNAPSR